MQAYKRYVEDLQCFGEWITEFDDCVNCCQCVNQD